MLFPTKHKYKNKNDQFTHHSSVAYKSGNSKIFEHPRIDLELLNTKPLGLCGDMEALFVGSMSTLYYLDPYQCYVGLTTFHGSFSIFRLKMGNILHNIVSPTYHSYGVG